MTGNGRSRLMTLAMLATTMLTLPLAGALATAQTAPAVQPARTDAAAVVTELRRLLRENYVIKERRAALDAVLAKGLADGSYARLQGEQLAERLTRDMAAIAKDKHLSVGYDPRQSALQIGRAHV